ncbi:tRNA preQ1(34) S-adenosylmethionine ribosyltransferase-isomerase QueA [Candidatus Gracilibacteria bacterium]|jgi:S-adenosylmethionine:tRNA ribosyltransferase-isomerase|nr:tRNA preQ1(34) S-adenosylmethionine ribosyltransferase-isomerase QueA [Candidatus Gracilibacteria bacterium]
MKEYRTSDFDYVLPKEFIAQNPVTPRDSSKLLVYDVANDKIYHKHFYDVCDYLKSGDTLVVNRSKVIPARIVFGGNFGKPQKEVFLLKENCENIFNVLVKPGRLFLEGKIFTIAPDLQGEVLEILEDGTRNVRFWNPASGGSFSAEASDSTVHELLEKYGRAPLPPYIKKSTASFSQYQTVYAKEKGSVAAPTAGLHFTPELISKIKNAGISMQEVLLHVGRGTFLPVTADKLSEHKMHNEFYVFSKENADALNKAKDESRRIIAVGTTSVRVLESVYDNGFEPKSGETDIFIYPGKHDWKVIDALITNFHLPKSTLIMLVASFLEHKGVKDPVAKILSLYEVAKDNNYRFFSFGDAMYIF